MHNLYPHLVRRFRQSTNSLRAVPDFIVIGGMKCGSTALYEYLIQHPHVLPCATKEVHFFDSNFRKGLTWYRQFFPLRARKGTCLTGEASPYYIFHPLVAQRIRATLPNVKLVAVLRNPVERAFSHYQHTCRKGYETLSFEEAIAQEAERLGGEYERLLAEPCYKSHSYPAYSYVARGLYWIQLERYFELFDRSQLLVVQSETLRAHPQETINHVCTFLGLKMFELVDSTPKNRAGYNREQTHVHKELERLFKPHNEKLFALLGESFDWNNES